jgi:hypothetical protein
LVCTTNQSIPFGCLHLLLQVHQVPFLFSGIFIAKEVDGVRDMGSGDTSIVEVKTLLRAFLKLSLRSAHFTDEFFSDEKQNFRSLERLCSNVTLSGFY